MVIQAKEKKERALGEKLFLKAHRCNSPNYGNQLNAKQKFKLSYGVNERQMTSIFKEAARDKESTGEKIMEPLERRFDNAVFRSGLADSRIMARHFIVRGHFLLNGTKTVSPSYLIRTGDIIAVRPESKS